MQGGDIVLTYNNPDEGKKGKFTHGLIELGQKFKEWLSNNPQAPILTHAAIAVNETHVVEAVGEGITLTNLEEENNGREAFVLRLRNYQPYFPNGVAAADVLTALARVQALTYYMHRENGDIEGSYSKPKAVASIIAGAGRNNGLDARLQEYSNYGEKSFCSGLVVNCYEIANLQGLWMNDNPPPPVFGHTPDATTPSDLWHLCAQLGFNLEGAWSGNQYH
jgi:hypothetical protein